MILLNVDANYCVICGMRKEHTHHLVYGRGLRPLSDADKLYIPICYKCHDKIHKDKDGVAGKLSKMLGEAVWEAEYCAGYDDIALTASREAFRKRYGGNYL